MIKGRLYLLTIIVLALFTASEGWGAKKDWDKKDVQLRLSSGQTIKAVHYPKDKPVAMKDSAVKIITEGSLLPGPVVTDMQTSGSTTVSSIDSPPIDGFVPYIAVTTTDAKGQELDFVAVEHGSVTGNYTADNPTSDFSIGIYDTGASAHVFGNEAANRLGLFSQSPTVMTDNLITVRGVTGSVDAWVSYPLAVWVAGLGSVNNGVLNTANLVGESNVSVIVGQGLQGYPDLPTAIGTPMSVYFAAHIRNDQPMSITYNSKTYDSPTITMHDVDDPVLPSYPQIIPLELRPLGGLNVQYTPDLDMFDLFSDPLGTELDFSKPQNPSVIMGNLSQSVFFVHSVDLQDGIYAASDRERFMLDTGAQVSVVGSRVGARLGLDPANPEFEVEIQGVTGTITMEPGFYIDKLQIPALGQWLTFTNVPVVLLDVASPEGGTLDGIIGMNLFNDFNLIVRGGGLFLQDDPRLELGALITDPQLRLAGDIAPENGDGKVDMQDLIAFLNCWLATPEAENWNVGCDLAPYPGSDNRVNFKDFARFADSWMHSMP